MSETNNYQMAIDLLRCHLGLTEEEAKLQLGITTPNSGQKIQNQSKSMSVPGYHHQYQATH